MRRPLGYLLAWTAITAVAVAGSWVGLQPLLAAAAVERPPSVDVRQLREMATPEPTPTGTPSAPATAPTDDPEPSESASAEPTPSAPPEPTSAPPPAEPSTGTEWERVGDGDVVRRGFAVRGGEAVFEVSRHGVELVSHQASSGFEASVQRWSQHSMVVSFTSGTHTSRVWVQWRNRPYAEIAESV